MTQENQLPGQSNGFRINSRHYQDLKRKNIIRLFLTYLAPIIIISVYFLIQNNAVVSESRRLHLKAIAENQANLLDLFLNERLVNLSNLINDPRLKIPPDDSTLYTSLAKLKSSSAAFIDIGYFDSSGIQLSYSGPFPDLEKQNYRNEDWFKKLSSERREFLITDIYLGFRQKPHFTIAVKRLIEDNFIIFRATLDPGKMYEYISALEGSGEVNTSIVNTEGYYQLVTPHIGTPLESSSFVPPLEPRVDAQKITLDGRTFTYGYSWLKNAGWALIVQHPRHESWSFFSGGQWKIMVLSAVILIIVSLVIIHRARQLVIVQIESDQTRAQLEHASKLASVGELAAGIAHEINNPLAVISEETGLMKDYLNPEFEKNLSREQMIEHLDTIHEAVFRCRDITRKLLKFVRKSDVDLKPQNVHSLLDDVVDGILGDELSVSNTEIIRNYDPQIPEIITDGNQLQQVILNIINNASDAIGGRPGRITIETKLDRDVYIAISDTGCGMTADQMNQVFMPFFTTKEVGKGTGLGLSVSYGIVKNLGGTIMVESEYGRGSTFTIVLPVKFKSGIKQKSK